MELAARYVNREEARKKYGAQADAYGRALMRSDPLADDVVAWLHQSGERGRAMLERALARGIGAVPDAPPPLARFFAQIDTLPDWVEPQRLARGAHTYQRVGPWTLFVLSAWSLMNGYHSSAAVKPLAFTGRLAEDSAPRRLAETGRFIVEVAQTGGLHRFARGFEITIRVRLVHAHVRAALARSGQWDRAAWGVAINQGDMLGTLLEFSMLWVRGNEMLGFHFDPQDREDVLHLWRYVGYLMGVEEELLEWIDTYDHGVETAEMMHLVQPGPDEDSLRLAAALREVPRKIAKTPIERLMAPAVIAYHDGLTWAFNGDRIARELGIPNRIWRHAIVPTRMVVRSMERARRILPGATWLAGALGNRDVRARIAYILEHREPTFDAAA